MIAEVSATWVWWNHCVKAAKMFPNSKILQANAQRAQMHYLIVQAEYLASIRP